jgi:hypothetical protein
VCEIVYLTEQACQTKNRMSNALSDWLETIARAWTVPSRRMAFDPRRSSGLPRLVRRQPKHRFPPDDIGLLLE